MDRLWIFKYLNGMTASGQGIDLGQTANLPAEVTLTGADADLGEEDNEWHPAAGEGTSIQEAEGAPPLPSIATAPPTSQTSLIVKWVALLLLVLQNSSSFLTIRHTKTAHTDSYALTVR